MATYREKVAAECVSLLFYRDVLAEFVGTFMLVAVQAMLPLSWGDTRMGNVVQTAMGMGFIVCVLANGIGVFGGGHFNPAVSLAMAVALKVTAFRAMIYIVVQCLGGMAGAGLIFLLIPEEYREGLAATTLHPSVSPVQGLFIETLITFNLVLTIFGATNDERKGQVYMPPIPIGFSVALGILSSFRSTGGSMNPARTFGPAVVMGIWENHWVYWAGPLLGGILAAGLYVGILDKAELLQKKLQGHPPEVDSSMEGILRVKQADAAI